MCNVEYSKADQNVRWRQARWQPNGAELGTRAILMASFLDSRIHTSAVRTVLSLGALQLHPSPNPKRIECNEIRSTYCVILYVASEFCGIAQRNRSSNVTTFYALLFMPSARRRVERTQYLHMMMRASGRLLATPSAATRTHSRDAPLPGGPPAGVKQRVPSIGGQRMTTPMTKARHGENGDGNNSGKATTTCSYHTVLPSS